LIQIAIKYIKATLLAAHSNYPRQLKMMSVGFITWMAVKQPTSSVGKRGTVLVLDPSRRLFPDNVDRKKERKATPLLPSA
jgi:hypothetical protein